MRFMLILIISLYLAACATSNQNVQRPAPHNDFTGKFVEKHFAGEDANDYMMRACKIYGGLNQDSIQKKTATFCFKIYLSSNVILLINYLTS